MLSGILSEKICFKKNTFVYVLDCDPNKNVYSHNCWERKMFISLIVLKQTVFQLQFSFQTAWEPLVHISVHRQRESIPKSFENKLKNRLPWIHPLIANHKSWILFYWPSSLQPEGSPVLWAGCFLWLNIFSVLPQEKYCGPAFPFDSKSAQIFKCKALHMAEKF